ncbi:nucleolar complex-associated protein 2-like isoform X1 [Coffea arabica]|uniref:Nucleolar complex-associated protein 2-like isoform X1 n=2 Tax=Coffea arabica TaxID=13443 RepID=A0ABM4USA0_COFAR
MEFGGARKRGRPDGGAATNGNGGIKISKQAKISENEALSNDEELERKTMSKKKIANEHMQQLQRLQEKDPEFYEFLKEHDKELLDFNDEDVDDEAETDVDSEDIEEDAETDEYLMKHVPSVAVEAKSSKNVITTAMVDSWCKSIQENTSLGAVRALMKAYRTACHYGDDSGDDNANQLSIMSSSVFNKIMLFVLSEMDGILRGLLKLPPSGGKKETLLDLMSTRLWKNYNHLVKSYLGNSLHVLNQMTDTKMISFTLRRLRYSSIFLAAYPALLRKYVKVVLHFWGSGGGALPVVSLLFLRDLCLQFGSGCIDDCFKGMYKAYVLNCQSFTATKLQHIQFLGNCFTELLRVDLGAAYQHAFIFIRQLAMILRETTTRTKKNSKLSFKELFRKVYGWKFMNCLELWTGAICAYSSEADLKPLAYPLTQIITATARLVPTAQYFPLRLWCIKMLNRIAASTGTFIPVSLLLLEMLEIKELHRPPTGGVGEAVDFRTMLRVKKSALKTRAFQEMCVFSVIEELTEHLAQWSYSAAFFELSFVPTVQLREFCKSTKVERFRREMRQLIRQIEANCEFTNKKRMSVAILPNDPGAASLLEDEKMKGSSPLSQYATVLRERAQQRNDSITQSSVTVGERASIFGSKITDNDEQDHSVNEEGVTAFNSGWLPGSDSTTSHAEKVKEKRKRKRPQEEAAFDEDVVEELILSSDEDEDSMINAQELEDTEEEPVISKRQKMSQQPLASLSNLSKKKRKYKSKKSNKKK